MTRLWRRSYAPTVKPTCERGGVEAERAAHGDAHAVDVLVSHRRMLPEHLVTDMHEQVTAGGLDLEPVGTVDGDAGVAHVGAGRKHEVVFELLLVAVVDDVDAGPDALGDDAAERLDAGLPAGLVTDVAVDDTGQTVAARQLPGRRLAIDAEHDAGAAVAGHQRDLRAGGRHRDVIALTASHERPGAGVGARFEVQRQRRDRGERPRAGHA